MFWADRIAGEIERRFGGEISSGKPIVIRDEKTLSGRVHIGSMRSLALHGILAQILTEKGIPNVFKYELNDMDPMDGFPVYLPEEFRQYMGQRLKNIPSPEPSAENFAEYFGNDYRSAVAHAGFSPEYYRAHELYESGQMDDLIFAALKNADVVRSIYKEVSGSIKPEGWLPISVICPQCGKMVTTEAKDFDGDTVAVVCQKNKVDFAQGCGFEGRVSPFGGKAKLTWKVDWAAKWKVNGVMVEGAGKDHYTKGGSRHVANQISKEIFKYESPFDIPHEFILVGGAKMSSSKGKGTSAREVADLLPTKIFRLMLLGKDINQQFNFDPEGDTIPTLFDQYDKLAEGYRTNKEDDYARLFELIHADKPSVPEFLLRFSQVAFLVQMPHHKILDEAAKIKGSPLTEAEQVEIAERAQYALRWLENYAPEKYVFKLQDSLPEDIELTKAEQRGLGILYNDLAIDYPEKGEVMHALIRAIPVRPGAEVEAKALFTSIYKIFLNKESGPQAGWFLAALPKDFVLKRLKEASEA
jgi:lysyl-tRNA synthetase class 1